MFNPKDFLSEEVKSLKPSGIRKFFDVASTMKDVISLGVGEPDFVTPWHVRDAAVKSLSEGRTHYTSNYGLIELRQEINKYIEQTTNVSYDPLSEILVTVGASEALDIAIRSLVSKGDEVLVPEPSFVCYKPCVTLAGGTAVPVITASDNGFKLTYDALKEKITTKTKVLILPYPNNPTGGIMEKEDLEAIVPLIKENNLIVISDEIYSELTYNKKHISIASLPEMRDRTILINGFSKAFAMTGWRLGYACCHKDILDAMVKIHQYIIMSAPTLSQYAAVDALKNGRQDIEDMKEEYNMRRIFIVSKLNEMGMKCFNPVGAFYVFPSIEKFGLSSEEFCERLLYEEKLAIVPGNAFGESGEGFVRISYAYSQNNITKALKRLENFLEKL